MDNESPLEGLVASPEDLDEDRLMAILQDRIEVNEDRTGFILLPPYVTQATIRQGAVLTLLAQRALHVLNPEMPPGLAPKDVSSTIGAKGASVRPVLKDLKDAGVLVKNGDGLYEVRSYALDEAERILEADDG